MSKFLQKIKSGFDTIIANLHYSQSVKDYLFLCNVRSSVYVSLVVAALEIWMLISVILGTVTSDGARSMMWIVKHTVAYVILLITAIIMLVYSILYLSGKTKNQFTGYAIKIFFTFISLAFGLYISYVSYDRSGQAFVFMTMIAFCLCLFV